MDKSWMKFQRGDPRYWDGLKAFVDFAKQNKPLGSTFLCPCKRCRLKRDKITADEMYLHLFRDGMMSGYINWIEHGEVRSGPSLYTLRQEYIEKIRSERCSSSQTTNPTMDLLNEVFPFGDVHGIDMDHTSEAMDVDSEDICAQMDSFEKYQSLLAQAQTPLCDGSNVTVLDAILKSMQLKVDGGWSDKSFDGHLKYAHDVIPDATNKHPSSYKELKRTLKNLGLGYEQIHACEFGCILFYKENKDLLICPVCDESRYNYSEDGKGRVPRRVLRYFPLIPRLKRLYMSSSVAKEMRWHGERIASNGELRHPADGEQWQAFDMEYPEFANDVRNVRLGLATDGFSPYGSSSGCAPYSTWPVMVVPYNLPPWLCMKKEFNLLVLLIAGPKSPGKCLSVFMRPLIDELQMLWNPGVVTYDRFSGSSFCLRAAVLWTISDFPGLCMLAGAKKGYKACPVCLDKTDARYLIGRMAYMGHRKWLPTSHRWRFDARKFDNTVDERTPPPSLSGDEILCEITKCKFDVLSMHPRYSKKNKKDKMCWTHKTMFYELPYWKVLRQPYALDVMHIEKNVFDNIIGTILGLEGKTKDDQNAREAWKKLGVREELWVVDDVNSKGKGKVSQAPYTVLPSKKQEIFEWLSEAKYPQGYAGCLKSKVNVKDKRFIGLKTHDCHVILQCLLPIIIRPYLPREVVKPLVALSTWFKKLCCREMLASDLLAMKEEIIIILCKLEMIFPPAFFTIMLHLLVHLPDQVLLMGPVHYSWMYPIERQLGEYKRFVRNQRYPEGSITEQYIAQECVKFCRSYIRDTSPTDDESARKPRIYNISCVSDLVTLVGGVSRKRLSTYEVDIAHWCVMENCKEAEYFVMEHYKLFAAEFPSHTTYDRLRDFRPYFLDWVLALKNQGSDCYTTELECLASFPQAHTCYSRCQVNGVMFVIYKCDEKLKTQNSGVMINTGLMSYYGVIENVIELKYKDGMPVVIFECRWFDTDKGNTRIDHGLLSIDTSKTWYEEAPYCLALHAQQVFYLDDPKLDDNWKIVNVVSQRGTYSDRLSLTRDDTYQEHVARNFASSSNIHYEESEDDDQ